jgi:putative acetyltransferase
VRELRQVGYDDARALVSALNAEMSQRYEDESESPADAAEFLPPYGVFLMVDEVACGGLRLLEPGIGEVKRMYVAPSHRGQGVSRLVLRALLDHARAVGLAEVWLETGVRQPEAISLYESEGFTPIAAYGFYKENAESRCFRLVL